MDTARNAELFHIRHIGIIALTLVLLSTIYGISVNQPAVESLQTATETPTPTSDHPNPIYTHSEAEDRALSLVPELATPSAVVARLVSTSTLASEWFGASDAQAWFPDTGLWIVGVAASNLTYADLIPRVAVEGFGTPVTPDATAAAHDQQSVEGAYFVFEASGGLVVARGVLRLGPGTPQPAVTTSPGILEDPPDLFSFDAITSLADEAIAIRTATALPNLDDFATSQPTPSPAP